MAMVIELFGAPGTGKSSLMRALDGRRIGDRTVIAAHRLLRVPRRWPFGLLLRRDLSPAERRRALAERRDDWSALLEVVGASSLGRDGGDVLRALHAPGWLATTLVLRALADTASNRLVAVLDEGLVQRSAVVCGTDPDDATLTRFLRALPRPTLHVHLVAEPAVLVGRLRGRDRTIDRHVGLDDSALEASVADDLRLMVRCAEGLAGLGAPVRTFTSGEDVAAVADDVVGLLGGLG